MTSLQELAREKIKQALDARAARNEVILRDCLARWVSEAEPVTVWQQNWDGLNEIIGLTALNDPTVTLYVHARTGMN